MLCCVRMQMHRLLVNLVYPPVCLLCRASLPSPASMRMVHSPAGQDVHQRVVCDTCSGAMPRSGLPLCARCGIRLSGAFDAILVCAVCRRASPAFDVARAPWQYHGLAEEAIRQFKYHRRWRLGRWLADEMIATARASLPLGEISVVLPTPLHWLKRHLTGFDPVAQLATDVANALQKPCRLGALRRIRWTATQTRLHWNDRFRNVHQAFSTSRRWVEGHSVLLVDDVLTSGATADACAQTLKTSGARAVFVLTAARTPLERC